MPNYKETAIAGEAYQRSFRIIIENKKDSQPHITFLEERVVTIDGQEEFKPVDQVTVYFDPTGTFPLINPLTDAPLGANGSHVQLQVLLYSLYSKAADDRDAAAVAP